MPRATTKATVQRAREDFLAALKSGASVSRAAQAAPYSRDWFYEQRKADEVFASAWDASIEQGTDFLEDEAVRRGAEGVEEPVVANGRIAKDDEGKVLYRRVYSDTLLLATLKRRRPDAWRERSTQDVNLKAEVDIVDSPRERLAGRIAGVAARAGAGSDPGGPDGSGS